MHLSALAATDHGPFGFDEKQFQSDGRRPLEIDGTHGKGHGRIRVGILVEIGHRVLEAGDQHGGGTLAGQAEDGEGIAVDVEDDELPGAFQRGGGNSNSIELIATGTDYQQIYNWLQPLLAAAQNNPGFSRPRLNYKPNSRFQIKTRLYYHKMLLMLDLLIVPMKQLSHKYLLVKMMLHIFLLTLQHPSIEHRRLL